MTITEQAPAPAELSDELAAAAGAIADRLRTKTVDQVIAVGERTGWWAADLVDWVAGGRQGPPPQVPVSRPITIPSAPPAPAEPAPAEPAAAELPKQPVDAGILDTAPIEECSVPADDNVVVQLDSRRRVDLDADMEAVGSAYITVLQARELGVDHTYQRPLDEARVARMVENWNPRMLGTIDVSDRGPDETPRYAVINGQHRAVAAARVSGAGSDVWLPCTVHEGLDVAAEAQLMHDLDRSTKKLTGFDQWRARRVAGDPVVAQVEAVCRIHMLRVDPTPTDGSMRSYGAAEKLLKLGGRNLLDNTLGVLRSAYGTDYAAYQAPLLTGVGQLLHSRPDVDVARLRNALANTRPEKLRAAATALRDTEPGPLHRLMTEAIVARYNRTPGPRIGGRS